MLHIDVLTEVYLFLSVNDITSPIEFGITKLVESKWIESAIVILYFALLRIEEY